MSATFVSRMIAVFCSVGVSMSVGSVAQATRRCGGLEPVQEFFRTKNAMGITALRESILETAQTIGTSKWPENQLVPLSVVELLQQVYEYKEAERKNGGKRGFTAPRDLIDAAGLNPVDLSMISTQLVGKMIGVNQLSNMRTIVIDYQHYISPGKTPYMWETGGPQGKNLSVESSTNMRMMESGNSANNLSVGPWLVGKNITVTWSRNGDKNFTTVTGKLLNALNGDFTRGVFSVEINGEPYIVSARTSRNTPANYQLRAENSKFEDGPAFTTQFENAVSGESLVPKAGSDFRYISGLRGQEFQVLIKTPMGEKSVPAKSVQFTPRVGASP
jgi:hypothetical protein